MKRVVLIELISNLILQIPCTHPLRVAIDGVDACGKTIFANELAEQMKLSKRAVIRASVDDFHNPKSVRRQKGSLSPAGFYHDSYNYPSLIKNVLEPLGPAGDRRFQRAVFDLQQDKPTSSPFETAPEDAVLLLDGIFLLRPQLISYWDITLFLHADFTNTLPRGVARDADLYGSTAQATRRFQERYIPGQLLYLQEANPLDKADILIDNNNLETPEILRISEKLCIDNQNHSLGK